MNTPLPYRAEIFTPLFKLIRARESCAIVGCASMGKSRLVRFALRPDVRRHYLDLDAESTLLVHCDCNRLAHTSEWGLYELILTALVETGNQHPQAQALRPELNQLRREVITSRDALLARRHAELATLLMCREQALSLCFVLDEFDEAYRTLPPPALANLRALRDEHKASLCFALVMRDLPARLRPPSECEGFYELFSRSILPLRPYGLADALDMIHQLEARRSCTLPDQARQKLIALSGGHPGLVVALFDGIVKGELTALLDAQVNTADLITQSLGREAIADECRKLWASLKHDEQLALIQIAHGLKAQDVVAQQALAFKGLVRPEAVDGASDIFSPLFHRFIRAAAVPDSQPLWVDERARVVWVGKRRIGDLTAREFDLLAYLFQHLGEVRDRQQILSALYPNEHHNGVQDNSVDALVKRIRKKIEPSPRRPRYLISVRGKGYKLDQTDSAT